MARGPHDPMEYVDPDDPDDQAWTDERLDEEGYASGLDVWGAVDKVYANELRDGSLANGQLWSLRRAVRRELLTELGLDVNRA